MASEGIFRFKRFDLRNRASAMKLSTDSVLLGTLASIGPPVQVASRQSDSNESTHSGYTQISENSSIIRVLDAGAGTGVVALMLAQRLADAGAEFDIKGIDIDGAAAEEAGQNFAESPWAEHLHAENTPLQALGGTFDLVVSNPPFYDNSLLNPDSRAASARHTLSLSYRDICAWCDAHLAEDGRLALILPSEAEMDLVRCAGSFGLHLCRIVRIRTTERKQPRRIVAEFSRMRVAEAAVEELTLQSGADRTTEFTALLEPFFVSLK